MSMLWLLCFCNVFVNLAGADDDGGGKHFVLIHGLGHGAWCWYKVTAALRTAGHTVTALYLTSNGNNKAFADNIINAAQFVRPLIDFLAVYDGGRVILVGHSIGGSAISLAMEAHPKKIEKAVFLAALMPTNGQTFLPIRTFAAMFGSGYISCFMELMYNDIQVEHCFVALGSEVCIWIPIRRSSMDCIWVRGYIWGWSD
ncbi:hypothetical protein GOP47_0010599 [Adiantum capillus-veneris]|uniref:AB hydrolase-1 domain-containing protein n=1 Tax=Adiantum capillus-veneris TaxID=13818 RepID=A0A9D4UV78_ADICA|nr:hypothetical protein GOP47_0010599 [Adiantum capillus-veneris]